MTRLILLLLSIATHSLFTGPTSLEMTCEHTVIPEQPCVIFYVTLHNKTSEPIDVITCLPNVGAALRGATWMFEIQSSLYADESEDHIPIKTR